MRACGPRPGPVSSRFTRRLPAIGKGTMGPWTYFTLSLLGLLLTLNAYLGQRRTGPLVIPSFFLGLARGRVAAPHPRPAGSHHPGLRGRWRPGQQSGALGVGNLGPFLGRIAGARLLCAKGRADSRGKPGGGTRDGLPRHDRHPSERNPRPRHAAPGSRPQPLQDASPGRDHGTRTSPTCPAAGSEINSMSTRREKASKAPPSCSRSTAGAGPSETSTSRRFH